MYAGGGGRCCSSCIVAILPDTTRSNPDSYPTVPSACQVVHTVHGRADNIPQEYPPISLRDARCDLAKSVVAVTLPQTSGVARNGRASPVGQFSSATTSGAPKAESSLTTAKGSFSRPTLPFESRAVSFKARQEDGDSFYGCWQRYGGMVRAETEGVQQIGVLQSRDSHMSEFRITCREDPPTSHKPGETPLCSVSRLAGASASSHPRARFRSCKGGTSLLLSSASTATIVKIGFCRLQASQSKCKRVRRHLGASFCEDPTSLDISCADAPYSDQWLQVMLELNCFGPRTSSLAAKLRGKPCALPANPVCCSEHGIK